MGQKIIHVDGLKKFQGDLKLLDAKLPGMVRKVMNEAAQIVVEEARRRMPHDTGAAKRSIRVASTQTKARIRAGGSRAPYYPWLDYGGNHKHPRDEWIPQLQGFRRRKVSAATRPWMGLPLGHGRYLYPALEDNAERVHQVMLDGLFAITAEIWPDRVKEA